MRGLCRAACRLRAVCTLFAICGFLAVELLSSAGAARADDAPPPPSEGKSALPVEPDYYRLVPITFSVIGEDNKIDEEVTILLSIEMANGNKEPALDPYVARIQDAFLVALNDMWDSQSGGSRVTDQQVKDKLGVIARKIAGDKLVSSVLVLGISEKLR